MSVKAFELFGEISLKGDSQTLSGLKQISAEVDAAEKKVSSLHSTFSKFSNANFSQGFLSSFGIQRGGGLDALGGAALGNLLQSGIQQGVDKMRDLTNRGMEYYDTVRMAQFAFTNLLGSSEKATQHVKDLLLFARETPFEDVPVIKFAQGLEAVGVQASNVTTVLRALGNAMVASGDFSTRAQEGTMLAVTQMLGRPQLGMQEIRTQLRNYIPTIETDFSKALGLSVPDFEKKISANAINTKPAFDLLVDYYLKTRKGGLEFAGTKTFGGLESSKISAEDAAMAATLAGGDLFNPTDTSAAAIRMRAMEEQIKRRDSFRESGGTQNALGEMVAAYFAAKDKDDALIFSIAQSKTAGGITGTVADAAIKSVQQGSGPSAFGANIAQSITGGKTLMDDGLPALVGWAKSLFTSATAGSIDAVEKGKAPMEGAGAALGDSLIQGMKSQKGLDSQSPSKRAIAEGLNVRLGLAQGLTDGTINLADAGASLADEIFGGFGARRGGGFTSGMSQRSYLESVSQNPTVQAFFAAISKAEGGSLDVMAGGRHVNSGALHPGDVVPRSQWFKGSKGPSSAAGLFQITSTNWHSIAPQLGLDNFSDPHQQLLAALKIFSDHPGALESLMGGDIKSAMGFAAKDWTSTPGSTIGGGRQLPMSKWMGLFNGALAGGNTADGTAKPIPVQLVAASGQIVDFGNSVAVDLSTGGPLKDISNSSWMFSKGRQSKTVNGGLLANVDVPVSFDDRMPTLQNASLSSILSGMKFEQLAMSMEKLTDATAKAATSTEGMTEEQIAAKRLEAIGDGKGKKAKKDKLFDAAFTKEGVAGDFEGSFTQLLSGLGHDKPMNLLKSFGMNLLQDIQGRIAHDISAQLTGALFGSRGEDGKLSGGLLGGLFGGSGGGGILSMFGSLFGGHRATGGPMDPGRLYIAGEHGPEAIWMGNQSGYAMGYGNQGGGHETRVSVYMGPKPFADAINYHGKSTRGRRDFVVNAKWARKLTGVTYA